MGIIVLDALPSPSAASAELFGRSLLILWEVWAVQMRSFERFGQWWIMAPRWCKMNSWKFWVLLVCLLSFSVSSSSTSYILVYIYIYIYIYKDSSASFSSSLCSKFVKIIVSSQRKLRKKKPTRMGTPPSLVHYTKKGTNPGNPPPQPGGPDPSPWPGPGELKRSLFSLFMSF